MTNSSPLALYEVVKLLQDHPEADVIYSDEDKLEEAAAAPSLSSSLTGLLEYLLSIITSAILAYTGSRWVDTVGGFVPPLMAVRTMTWS